MSGPSRPVDPQLVRKMALLVKFSFWTCNVRGKRSNLVRNRQEPSNPAKSSRKSGHRDQKLVNSARCHKIMRECKPRFLT